MAAKTDPALDGAQLAARKAAEDARRRLSGQMGKDLSKPRKPAPPREDPDETRRVELLGALARAAGDAGRAVRQLENTGVEVSKEELVRLRERHSGMYMALCDEITHAVEENIAQTYREIAAGSQRLTKGIIDQLNEDMDAGVLPRDLDRTLVAVTKVMQVSTDKLLSITGRPVSGQTSDPIESLKELQKLGVAFPRAPAYVDGTVEEEESHV